VREKCFFFHSELFEVAAENSPAVFDSIRTFVRERLSGTDENDMAATAAELVILSVSDDLPHARLTKEGTGLYSELLGEFAPKIREIAASDLVVAKLMQNEGLYSYEDWLPEHGLRTLPGDVAVRLLNVYFSSPFDHVFFGLAKPESELYLQRQYPQLARALEDADLDGGIHRKDVQLGMLHGGPTKIADSAWLTKLDPFVFFVTFIAGAIRYECAYGTSHPADNSEDINRWIHDRERDFAQAAPLNSLIMLWKARFDTDRDPSAPAPFGPLRFSPRQQRIVEDWVAKRLSIVCNAVAQDGAADSQPQGTE